MEDQAILIFLYVFNHILRCTLSLWELVNPLVTVCEEFVRSWITCYYSCLERACCTCVLDVWKGRINLFVKLLKLAFRSKNGVSKIRFIFCIIWYYMNITLAKERFVLVLGRYKKWFINLD